MNNTTDMDGEMISSEEIFLTLVVFVVTFVLGVVGNVLVFLVIFAKKERRTANDIFLLNLATADLLTVSVSLPLKLLLLVAPYLPLNCFVCKILYPMMTVPYCASIFTITSMAIQRRTAILNPWKGVMSHGWTLACVAAIWLLSSILTVPLSVFSNVQSGSCSLNWSQEQQKIYVVSIFFIQYSLPLTIIIIAYVQICLNLKKYQKNIVRQEIRKENIEITRTIAVIVVLFAVFTLPLQVFWLLFVYQLETVGFETIAKLHHYAELLTDFHSCLNPLVYGALTRRFRRKYTLLFTSVFKLFERPQKDVRSCNGASTGGKNDHECIRLKQRSRTV
ncbi:hypothetical protein QZH41_004904 [Actinostola sp. cb2023]|nr:hypothetical protein QZH41_004904 [Actinostola sp. cb2023]